MKRIDWDKFWSQYAKRFQKQFYDKSWIKRFPNENYQQIGIKIMQDLIESEIKRQKNETKKDQG